MKGFLFALLTLASMISLQADILANGNFTNGRAHWKGDAQDLDPSSSLPNLSAQGGVTITLKKDKWTKLYQTFTTRERKLHYSITCTLSPDYQPDQGSQPTIPGAFANPTPGLADIPGVPVYY